MSVFQYFYFVAEVPESHHRIYFLIFERPHVCNCHFNVVAGPTHLSHVGVHKHPNDISVLNAALTHSHNAPVNDVPAGIETDYVRVVEGSFFQTFPNFRGADTEQQSVVLNVPDLNADFITTEGNGGIAGSLVVVPGVFQVLEGLLVEEVEFLVVLNGEGVGFEVKVFDADLQLERLHNLLHVFLHFWEVILVDFQPYFLDLFLNFAVLSGELFPQSGEVAAHGLLSDLQFVLYVFDCFFAAHLYLFVLPVHMLDQFFKLLRGFIHIFLRLFQSVLETLHVVVDDAYLIAPLIDLLAETFYKFSDSLEPGSHVLLVRILNLFHSPQLIVCLCFGVLAFDAGLQHFDQQYPGELFLVCEFFKGKLYVFGGIGLDDDCGWVFYAPALVLLADVLEIRVELFWTFVGMLGKEWQIRGGVSFLRNLEEARVDERHLDGLAYVNDADFVVAQLNDELFRLSTLRHQQTYNSTILANSL